LVFNYEWALPGRWPYDLRESGHTTPRFVSFGSGPPAIGAALPQV